MRSGVNSFTPLSGIISGILKDKENAQNMRTSKSTTLSKSESADSISDFSDSDSESEDYVAPGDNETKYFQNIFKTFPSAKPMSSYYWSGIRWVDADPVRISRKFYKKELTIISWNVWFGLRNREGRMHALGQIVRQHDPDLIAFQEVTPDLLKLIQSQKWMREYFASDCDGKTMETYGNVVFSKVAFNELFMCKLESRMGRKAILANIIVKGSHPLVFGTYHLESHLEDGPYRASQLKAFKELTQHCPNVILVGDTNFTADNESDSLGTRFKDTWRELYQSNPTDAARNPGLTFDTSTNDMARQERSDLKQLRLDRCFYTHDTIEPTEMKIIGEKPYFPNEWISDHYGILIKLRVKENPSQHV
jgi:tyrosyl-DNA phosphodiesterase 2